MSFNDIEISTQDGRPVALYTLKWGKTYWRYTSADRAITRSELVDGVQKDVTYQPVAISDEGMVQGGSSNNNMTVSIPRNLPIVDLFNPMPPSESIWMTIRRVHDDLTEAPIYWLGLVSNVQGKGLADAAIVGVPISATFKRSGLRLCWGKGCPHILHDSECRVKPEDHAVPVQVTAASGVSFTVTKTAQMLANTAYRGGFITWTANADGTVERRTIENVLSEVTDDKGVTSITFEVFGVVTPLAANTAATLNPGCDLTPETCDTRFDNLANHGGFKFLAGRSPFDGEPVF